MIKPAGKTDSFIPEEYRLDSYNYELPDERIAQYPAAQPGHSRLLVLNSGQNSSEIRDSQFQCLPEHLPANALLVANNARVLPCRLPLKGAGGGKGEFLLLTPLPLLKSQQRQGGPSVARAMALLRPAKRYKPSASLNLAPGLTGRIIQKEEFGRHLLELEWSGDIEAIFSNYGSLPLPPYIEREMEARDQDRYQTCYAKKSGAIAAPTAGLHFTPTLRESLLKNSFEWQELTLYVGYGTFSPVRTNDIRLHKMHSELVEIGPECAEAINRAKRQGRPVVAVGTTSLRALESSINPAGLVEAGTRETSLFIYPGHSFRVANHLITNFHLPRSSLLMLVSAFAGRREILAAYRHAINDGYRFFSYGDAMFISRKMDEPI